MIKPLTRLSTQARALSVLLALSLLLACSTESPTAPEQVPAPDPGPGDNIWNVTVTVDPSVLIQGAGGGEPSAIRVRVRRRSNNQAPPLGTTAVVATSLGELGSAGSGAQSAVIELLGGNGEILMFPGTISGRATVVARLEGSLGSAFADIREEDSLFITAVSPSSGGEGGGTRITVEGQGFLEPLQLFVGGIPAVVTKVANDGTFVKADTPTIFDPDGFFATAECDADGDGEEDGEKFIPTRVAVSVTQLEGPVTSAQLPDAFTYYPSDSSCHEAPEPPDPPFIQEVDPNRGPESGGQTVDINGRGFRQPLRVFFQDKLAIVTSVTRNRIRVITPPGDMDTVACTTDPGGLPGVKKVDTPVQVKVEIIDGAVETLSNAYTYVPDLPNDCVG